MKKVIFYISFVFFFLAGGFINYFGLLPIKMAYISFLPFLLFFFLKVKINYVLLTSIIFFISIFTSAIVNQTELKLLFLYLQHAVTPFVFYFLADKFLNPKNIKLVLKLCLFIGIIQLPVVIAQKAFFHVISKFGAVPVQEIDIGFGTFYTSNDPSLAFFLLCYILFLLFDTKNNYFIKRKMFIAGWLTLSILALNSKLSILILALIWGFYIFTKAKPQVLFSFIVVFPIVISFSLLLGFEKQIRGNIEGLTRRISFNIDTYHSRLFYNKAMGNRPAAVLHHLNSPIRYFGNGPYSTFDPNTKKYKFGGDASHLLNVYADIGIIGLVLSYCMLIAKLKGREVNLYLLGCISTLFIFSSTVNILTDGSIMLAFNIFINSSLVRPLAIKQINS